MPPPQIGGSFAPPLDKAKLASYRDLAELAPPAIKDAMLSLCDMMEMFQQTPASGRSGSPHPVGLGTIIPLEDAEVKRIWDAVPWEHECDMYATLFDTLPTGTEGYATEAVELPGGGKGARMRAVVADPDAKALRDAAFHLLWFARELTKDREPLTSDRLQGAP